MIARKGIEQVVCIIIFTTIVKNFGDKSSQLDRVAEDDLSTTNIDYSKIVDENGFYDIYERYLNKHNKMFSNEDEEFECRKNIFEKIEKLRKSAANMKSRRSYLKKFRYTLTLNKLADLSSREFKLMLGYKRPDFLYETAALLSPQKNKGSSRRKKRSISVLVYKQTVNTSTLPKDVDWRTTGYVGPVPTQGLCGSCWAFAAVGALEGQYYLKIDNSSGTNLSAQNLIDCSQGQGNDGCSGGAMELAYYYVYSNSGINSEASYPYIAIQNPSCLSKPVMNMNFDVVGWSIVEPNNESALMEAVAFIGPIATAIDATPLEFQLYKDGVLCYLDCSRTVVNHGILIVGYKTIDSVKVWIIRNSWSRDWGMNGYGYLCRNTNFCGISHSASFPVLSRIAQDNSLQVKAVNKEAIIRRDGAVDRLKSVKLKQHRNITKF